MVSLHDTTTPATAPTDVGTSTGASPSPGRSRPNFPSWRDVPAGIYATETQLKTMDLPRRPGPPAATVKGQDGLGRTATLTLYRIDQSTPTASTAAQLAAARRRADPAARVCVDCGARPDRALLVSETRGPLCPACRHIEYLRHRQDEARARRAAAVHHARALLEDGRTSPLAIVHVDYTERGHTPAGTRRTPAAAKATILDASGHLLADPLLRLVGPRAKGVPPGTCDPQTGAEQLKALLAERTVLIWQWSDLDDLGTGLRSQQAPWPLPRTLWPHPQGGHHVVELVGLVADWRGEIMPEGHQPLPVPPGRADRMLLLLQQIAGTALSANRK
ncbi:hypothetical protein [Streptomyces sp. NPDC048225]|uniref:hypothetical protein n=1 Tax=Streptomyces sp. NPDC048225 TaxID=3365518 RepID=UPI00371D52A1